MDKETYIYNIQSIRQAASGYFSEFAMDDLSSLSSRSLGHGASIHRKLPVISRESPESLRHPAWLSYWKWPSRNSWFTHFHSMKIAWWFSIGVLLVYQRVHPIKSLFQCSMYSHWILLNPITGYYHMVFPRIASLPGLETVLAVPTLRQDRRKEMWKTGWIS